MPPVTAAPGKTFEAERFPGHSEKAQPGSPRLAAVAAELSGYIRRRPDITLGELRAAFLGTGYEWGTDGRLAFAPSRMTLIHQFDDLIEVHGWDARAADLFR